MTKQHNPPSARALMFRGSIYGALILSAVGSLHQDCLGREAYVELVQRRWVDARVTVPIAIAALVIGVVAYFVDAVRASGNQALKFDRVPVHYDDEDHSDKVQQIGLLMSQARDFELSLDERFAYLAQSSMLLNSIRTSDRVVVAWLALTRKQIDTLADELGLTTSTTVQEKP